MSENRKTILILASYGAVIRDVLRTELWATLKHSNHHFVIATPLHNNKEFCEEFSDDNITFVPLAPYRSGKLESLLRELHKLGFYHLRHSATLPLQEKRLYEKQPFMKFMRQCIYYFPLWNNFILRVLQRWIRHRVHIDTSYRKMFSIYQPDMVFSTMPFLLDEQPVLRLAADHNIPMIARIHSWDNISSKGAMMEHFTKVIVWSDVMRNELLRYYPLEYTRDDIIVTGVPQFDYYFTYTPIAREEFFQQLNISTQTKLILFSTAHAGISPHEPEYIQQTYTALEQSGKPFLLYIRLHPRDTMERYDALRNLPYIRFEYPGRKSSLVNDQWDPHWDDMKHFAHLLRYSDLNVNVASTVSIDAAIFDTPIINIAYDPQPVEAARSITQYYIYEHYNPIVASEGVTVVYSVLELTAAIQAYLRNSKLHSAGRRRIVQEQIAFTDGQSGKRIATTLLDYIINNTASH